MSSTKTFSSLLFKETNPSDEGRIAELEEELQATRARLELEIQEKEQVTHSLNEKNFHLTTLLEQMPAMLWTVDENMIITTSLGSGLQGIGVRPNELVGKRLQEYLQSESESNPALLEHREALSGRSFTYENRFHDRALAVNLQPLRKRDGNISGVIGVALDITKLKDTEKRLAGQAKILELISSENDQDVVFQETISFIKHLFGDVRASISLADSPGNLQAGDATWSHPILSSEGKVLGTLATHFRPPRDPTAQESADLVTLAHLLALSLERKLSQENLATTIHFLRASNADLVGFASILSHDLREPLRTAINYLNLICDNRAKTPEDAKAFAESALAVMGRMRKRIEGLLELSKIEPKPVEFGIVNFDRLLQAVLADIRTLVEESGASVRCEPLPEVPGDPVQLAQLMQNLIVNAIKYRREVPPEIDISTERENDVWIFQVRDNGQGFDMKSARRIFRPFYRMKPCETDDNLGIGLSVCERIIQRHGGKIWAESVPGQGSCFRFSLPG